MRKSGEEGGKRGTKGKDERLVDCHDLLCCAFYQ